MKRHLHFLLFTGLWLGGHAQRIGWVDYMSSSSGAHKGTGVVSDADGNVYVLGMIDAETYVQGDTLTNLFGAVDLVLMKYTAQGDLVHSKVFGGSTSDIGHGIHVDGTGHLYAECTVQGETHMSDTTYAAPYSHQVIQFDTAANFLRYLSEPDEIIAAVNGDDVAIAHGNTVRMLDTALNVQWTRSGSNANLTFSNYGPQGARSHMAFSNTGHLVLAGHENAAGGSVQFDALTVQFDPAGYCDELFVLRMEADGSALWARTLDSSSTVAERQPHVALDDMGNVYLALRSLGDTLFFAADTLVNTPSPPPYSALLKYDANGVPQWAVGCYSQGSMGAIKAITIDAQQEVSIAGWAEGPGQFGGVPLTAINLLETPPYVARLDGSGNVLWLKSPDPPHGQSRFNDLAVHGADAIVVTGDYPAPITPQVPFSIGCHSGPLTNGSNLFTFTVGDLPELLPSADFAYTVTGPATYSFTDLSTNALSWHWDFGDGTSATQQHPVHTYLTSGAFNVTLTAIRDACTSDTTVEVLSVGLEENALGARINWYPNPVAGVLNIEGLPLDTPTHLFLVSTTGSVITNTVVQGSPSARLDLAGIGAGCYLIRAITPALFREGKVILAP